MTAHCHKRCLACLFRHEWCVQCREAKKQADLVLFFKSRDDKRQTSHLNFNHSDSFDNVCTPARSFQRSMTNVTSMKLDVYRDVFDVQKHYRAAHLWR